MVHLVVQDLQVVQAVQDPLVQQVQQVVQGRLVQLVHLVVQDLQVVQAVQDPLVQQGRPVHLELQDQMVVLVVHHLSFNTKRILIIIQTQVLVSLEYLKLH